MENGNGMEITFNGVEWKLMERMGCNGVGWDGMGWDGMGWDGIKMKWKWLGNGLEMNGNEWK